MTLTIIAIQVIALLVPGFAFIFVYKRLQDHPVKKDWEDFILVVMVSICSYLLLSVISSLSLNNGIHFVYKEVSALQMLGDKISINLSEVLWASAISLILACVLSVIVRTNAFSWALTSLKITDKYGDKDLWVRFIADKDIDWVTVRDYKTGIYYFGKIRLYSETEKKREIILSDVTVYSEKTNEEYEIDRLYISRNDDDLSIEHKLIKAQAKKDGV